MDPSKTTPTYTEDAPWEIIGKVACPNCDVVKEALESVGIKYVVTKTFDADEEGKPERVKALEKGNTKYFPVVYDSTGKPVGSKANVLRFVRSYEDN